jgi:hypothetical protein
MAICAAAVYERGRRAVGHYHIHFLIGIVSGGHIG